MRKNLCTINQRGLSLTELIISLSIISVLSFAVMSFMLSWTEQHAITETRSALLADVQNAVDQIVDAVRLSSTADSSNRLPDAHAPGGNQFGWTSSNNTLILASAVEDTTGNIVFSDPASYTSQKNNQIYFVSNGVLYRRILAASVANNKLKTSCPSSSASTSCPADRVLARNVSNFQVKYFNSENSEVSPSHARSVEISLTLSRRKFSQLIQSVYKTRMVFRND